jgi:SNF2 family DNA or RNA helicase
MTSNTEANSGGNDAILGAFARLRQVAAFAKIDATVALVKSILLEEPSVVIFTYFVAVAKEVHRKLQNVGWTGELLVGETPSAKRQAMVDNFQVSQRENEM